ncbi:Uncharacterised protein [Vibrio cholerae]|nr:Uncharacterised protein [Vibrio cholerae]CSI34627.1 Uncharacterised protein [Vibrio cholerae]
MAIFRFVVIEQPDVRGNTRVVEQVVWQLNNRIQHVIFYDETTNITFTTTRITGKQA